MTPQELHDILLAAFGPQHWWPAGTPFEVAVGAVLTQNTAWSNVEQAIRALAAKQALTPAGILALPPSVLEPDGAARGILPGQGRLPAYAGCMGPAARA